MSNTSRSIASVPGCTANSDGQVAVVVGHLHAQPQPLAVAMGDQRHDHLEALGLDCPAAAGDPGG